MVNVGTSNADYPSATIITNYEYEVNRQDELRKISLLGVEFLPQFLNSFDVFLPIPFNLLISDNKYS